MKPLQFNPEIGTPIELYGDKDNIIYVDFTDIGLHDRLSSFFKDMVKKSDNMDSADDKESALDNFVEYVKKGIDDILGDGCGDKIMIDGSMQRVFAFFSWLVTQFNQQTGNVQSIVDEYLKTQDDSVL